MGAIFDISILRSDVPLDEKFTRNDFETFGDFLIVALKILGRGLDFERFVDDFFDFEVLQTFDARLRLGLARGGIIGCRPAK